jgi:hypothetical protein
LSDVTPKFHVVTVFVIVDFETALITDVWRGLLLVCILNLLLVCILNLLLVCILNFTDLFINYCHEAES